MAKATKAESDATADRVLSTAATLFAANGFASVGLEQVAATAGVTRGAVYHHFASKRGLFEAVAGRAQRGVAAAVVEAADAAPDPWSGILAGCRAFLIASLSDTHRRILLVDAPSVLGWSVWRQQDADASARHLEEALRELSDEGVISIHSVSGTTTLISGAMNEAALHIAESENPDETLESIWIDLERMLAAFRV
jgi:AcrR family transcriptional regulator